MTSRTEQSKVYASNSNTTPGQPKPKTETEKRDSMFVEMFGEAQRAAGVNPGGDSEIGNLFCGLRIFDPRSKQCKRWDGLVAILLVYTAYVTPYEVAFLKPGTASSDQIGMFVFNRMVDLVFTLDLAKTFLTPIWDGVKQSWMTDVKALARNYVSGWFTIDFISILPFWSMQFVMSDSGSASQLQLTRVIRLFRLLKLLRLLRGMRLIQKWQDQFGLLHVHKQLIWFMVLTITSAHWVACLWRLTPEMDATVDGCTMTTNSKGETICEPNPYSWMTNFNSGGDDMPVSEAGPTVQYAAAVYWSTMTLTTIGYGDITPKTPAEIWIATIAMMIGSSIYAYVVGAVCGTIANMDEAKQDFNRYSDALTIFCEQQNIPKPLALRLRSYFRQSRVVQTGLHHRKLLSVMSPTLVAAVAMKISGPMLLNVKFFNPENAPAKERYNFITAVTLKLEPCLFAAREKIITQGMRMAGMYLIKSGIAFGGPTAQAGGFGRVYTVGKWFGLEGILLSRRYQYDIKALNYVLCDRFKKQDLDQILHDGDFPHVYHAIRKAVLRLVFQLNVRRFLEIMGEKDCRIAEASFNQHETLYIAGEVDKVSKGKLSVPKDPTLHDVIGHVKSGFDDLNSRLSDIDNRLARLETRKKKGSKEFSGPSIHDFRELEITT